MSHVGREILPIPPREDSESTYHFRLVHSPKIRGLTNCRRMWNSEQSSEDKIACQV